VRSIHVGTLAGALMVGWSIVGLAFAAVWLLGVLPEGTTGYALIGCGAALLAAGLALVVHGRFLATRAEGAYADGTLLASRLQGLLGAAFAIKLAALVLGMLALRQSGVKFEGVASFCIAFATASVVSQVATALSVSRSLQTRPAPSAGPDHPPSR
jgi:hypothetical protein